MTRTKASPRQQSTTWPIALYEDEGHALMGGVRNREEKKKAAHVFSSGGGGGTKGPAVVDKRNVELECPHCDRTFKQVQRFREHIQKKHADAAEADSAPTAEPASAPSAGPQSQQQGKTMDVGAKAGFYTEKSPKMLLHEWCVQKKRPTPRYRITGAEEGEQITKAKVVLADPKDRDRDILAFLAAEHQCNSQEETGQRVAVTALHQVAGDRALHRVLPEMYRPLWHQLNKQAEKRAEGQARAAAAAEARQVREKARRMGQMRRVPKDVVMSEAQRRMVQSILREQGHDTGSSSAAGTAFQTYEGALGGVMAQLRSLGFGDSDAQDAVAITIAEGGQPSLEAALDWLCVHVPEPSLPARFAAGASDVPFQILHAANGKDVGDGKGVADPDLVDLMELGYGQDETIAALTAAKGNGSLAFQRLFDSLTGPCDASSSAEVTEGASADDADVWNEEREALQAIYGEEMHIPGPSQTLLSVDVHSTRLVLDFRIHQHLKYPSQPPLIGVRCPDIGSQSRLQLAKLLFEKGKQLLCEPMLFELATAVPDLLAAANRAAVHAGMLSRSQARAQPQDGGENGVREQDHPEVQQATHRQRHRQHHQVVDVARESTMLQERWKAWQGGSSEARMRATRSGLPASQRRASFLQALQQSKVVVIQGATGSGKSTQMPQYTLEQAIEKGQGGACNILVTQPRRISAVSVATRVAQERAERLGDVVGYSVRLDSRRSAHTRLLFCTTGVVLRRLLGDPTLEGVTHVVVDEVHERSADSDLLLLLLRDLLSAGSNPSLRVILMSATAEADAFVQYFDAAPGKGHQTSSCSIVKIPGFTHPVEDLHLEDILEKTGFQIGRGSKWAKKGRSEADSKGPVKAGPDNPHCFGTAANAVLQPGHEYSQATLRSLQNVDESLINYELLEALVCHIVSSQLAVSSDANAILIFMPGAPEISRLVRALQGSSQLPRSAQGQSCRILPLHGSLPPDQQAKVFDRVKPGQRKIVVATNVAETSITIDDVVCVIDCGRVKEIRYDAERGIARLQEGWVSLASAQQRRGRAGRVRPGVCYKLFSRRQAGTMEAHQLPEVLRMPLESLCLSVKTCLPHVASIQQALARLLSSPTEQAVAAAIKSLTVLGALDDQEMLTPLGQHLSKMPMDIRLAKTLIYASMLRCINPVLTIVAAIAWGKPVFLSHPDRREEANSARKLLAADSAAARSDHLLIVAAFSAWDAARSEQGRQAAFQVASEMYVSDAAMDATLNGRAEYAHILADLGFVSAEYAARCNSPDIAKDDDQDAMSGNARVIKAAICAGFYPSILRIEHPPRVYTKVLGGAMEADASPARLKFFDRTKGRVFIHPASINFDCGEFPSGWMMYSDITETSKVYVREASMVPVYALLLFGGKLTVHHVEGHISLDNWAKFKAPAQIATLVDGLRKEMEQLLLRKIEDPGLVLGKNRVVEAILQLLSHDGF